MHVLLLRPVPRNERFGLGPFFRIEPLGMEYIAAALETRGHYVALADLRFSDPVERLIRRQRPGLIGVAAMHALETDDGKLIYIQNAGMRHAAPDVQARLIAGEDVDPELVYFRTVPVFETSAPDLQWLARSIFVATAERHPRDVVVRVWRVE